MITEQKNYVHARMKKIPKDKQSYYAKIINDHREYLDNLINSAGNENTARTMREKLKANKKDYKELEQNLLAFLTKEGNEDIYTKFCESLLQEFTNISVDEKNLFTEDFKINPDAVLSYKDTVVPLRKVKEKHYLSTIEKRIKKAESIRDSLVEECANSKNPKSSKILDAINPKIVGLRQLYDELAKLNIKTVKKSDLEKQIDNTITINKQKIDAFQVFEENIRDLYKKLKKAGVVLRLEKRLREVIVGYCFVDKLENLPVQFSDDIIRKGIENTSAASQKVTFSKELLSVGKLSSNIAKNIKSKVIEKVGDNDYYIDFGVENVDNKIDFYIQINDNLRKGASFKSYDLEFKHPKAKGVTLARGLNVLSLILGMNSLDKSYAFLNTIAPQGDSPQRENALNILKRQAVYAAATGHLGGRELINNNQDKAEYLVIEDTNQKDIYIYAMSTIIKNLEGYVFMSPNPFTLDKYNKYFINTYIKSKSGKDNAIAAMERNTILLLKLRQTKMHIGIKKEVFPNGNISTANSK